MNQGKSLLELAQELERQNESKKDYLAPSRLLEIKVDNGNSLRIEMDTKEGAQELGMTQLAENQLAEWGRIPAKYRDIMKNEAPELLADNLNYWLTKKDQPRLLRTLDGNLRAFLSNRYRTIDNYDIAMTTLPILINDGKVKIVSSNVTDNHLYIKAITDRLTFEVKPGDYVQAGIVISNSEVGLGSVKIEPLLYRLVCTNGAIINDLSMKRYHVGRHTQGGDEFTEIYRDATRKADDRAFMMKVQDVIKAAFDEVQFRKLQGIMVDSTTRRITKPLDEVLDKVIEKFDIREKEKSGILMRMVEGGDLSQWGLANAITNLANTQEDYERSTDLERVGGEIVTLDPSQWKVLAEVA